MEAFRTPQIKLETIHRTVLVTDARNSSKAYFSEKADEALVRIERDRALFAQIASAHGGEEVRDRGDGSMFTFCDPVEAVRAAMAMQAEIARLNLDLPPETLRLVHRMGIHVGEIKLATTRIVLEGAQSVRRKMSGDIVVTAARLEAICHPGEVCFSNDVYKLVHGAIEHPFRFLDSTLKGFDRPIRVWSTRLDLEWARPLTAEEELGKQRRKEERRLREKWEDELREKRRYRVRLCIALLFALVGAGFGTGAFARTDRDLGRRWDGAMAALFGPGESFGPVDAPAAHATRPPPPALLGRTFDAPRKSSSLKARPPKRGRPRVDTKQVAQIVRTALESGEYGTIGSNLDDVVPHPANYGQICADAARMERLMSWLRGQFVPMNEEVAKPKLCSSLIEGLKFLTGIGEEGIDGLDANESPVTLRYGALEPKDLFPIIQTMIPHDELDNNPGPQLEYKESLARLQRVARG